MIRFTLFPSVKKIDVMTLLASGLMVLSGLVGFADPDTGGTAKPMIPELNWTPRSDWLNVKTSVTPAAVGDGVADDTAALQAALSSVQPGTTIYLPPGKYRITKTLDFNQQRPTGIAIIGHGRSTILDWQGEEGGRMLWVHGGAVYARYVGLTWQGNNKAAVAIDHAANTFETEVTHMNEAFLNFTFAGIRIGYVDPASKSQEPRFETAEVEYDNCLFENCQIGAASLQFNDYDNTFDGCEFRHCGDGIKDRNGNVYARDSHFEDSSDCDISLSCEHSSSVRRCTSSGSNRFIEWLDFPSTLAIQDCHVAGWKAPDGAIKLAGGPVMLFDSTFTTPNGGGTPVQLANGDQRLVWSNSTVDGGGSLLLGGDSTHVVNLPGDKPGGVILSATQSFLKQTVTMPPKIFDAKVDYGAKGDTSTDDTDAVQKTIDAARDYGQGAVAYLPTGNYVLHESLKITGANYTVEGSGFRACLIWRGAPTGTMVSVTDPDHVTLQYINVGSHDAGKMDCDKDIHETSSNGQPSFMTYNHVDVFGMYQKQPDTRGFVSTGLAAGSVVHVRHLQGNLRFVDSAQAKILLDTSYEGSITVSGKDTHRDGFLGFQMRLSTATTAGLYVRDNHDIVMSDYYIEQADDGYFFQGNPDDPEGKVVIQGAKLQAATGPVTIDNYGGTICLGPEQYYLTPKPAVISIKGERPLDLILVANMFYATDYELHNENTQAHVFLLGNDHRGQSDATTTMIDDHFSSEIATKSSLMLDELRKLGQLDIQLNYPNLAPGTKP